MGEPNLENSVLKENIESYLEAFESRDLAKCLDYYTEDAALDFQLGSYLGREQIKEWHKERFAADLKLIRVDEIQIQGETLVVEFILSSNRLKEWKIDSLNAKATFVFQQGKIKEAKFGLGMNNPEFLWQR